jgi:hypothetical protein
MLTIDGVAKECKPGRGGWTQSELSQEAKKRGFTGPERASKQELCDFLLPQTKKKTVKIEASPKRQSPRKDDEEEKKEREPPKEEVPEAPKSPVQELIKIIRENNVGAFKELVDPDLTLMDPENKERFLIERTFESGVNDELRTAIHEPFFAQISTKFPEDSEVLQKFLLRIRDLSSRMFSIEDVKLLVIPEAKKNGLMTLGKIPFFLKQTLKDKICIHKFAFFSVWGRGEYTIPENLPSRLAKSKVPVVYLMFFHHQPTRKPSALFFDVKTKTFFHIDIFDEGNFKEVCSDTSKKLSWRDISDSIFPKADQLQFIFARELDPSTREGRINELALVCYLIHFRVEFPEVPFEKLFLKFGSISRSQIHDHLEKYKAWIAGACSDTDSCFSI